MALPRYQNIGIAAGGSVPQIPSVQQVNFPVRGEATRGYDALTNAMDVMASTFFKEAQIAATDEGRAYGAQNAPSQEQIKLAVETGTPIQPIGDSRTYFGRAAQEVSTRIAAIGVEAQAQLDMKKIKEGISTGAIGPSSVLPQVNSLIQGYSTALGQFDPVMGRKLQAELAKDGNTLYLAATSRAAAMAAAAAKKAITDVADAKLDNVKFVLEAGDRVVTDSNPMGEQTTSIVPAKDMVRVEQAKFDEVISRLKPKEQEKYREAWDKEVVKGVDLQVSNAILNNDVESVKQQLVSGEYRDLLRDKPEARYALINKIEYHERQVRVDQERENKLEAGRYQDQINNAIAALTDGRTDVDLSFYSREKTAKLFGENAERENMKIESALRINSEVSKLALATPAEQQATLQRLQSEIKTNAPDYQIRRNELAAIQTVITNNNTALKNDPAVYATKSPAVREAYTNMQQTLSNPESTDEMKRNAIDNYARNTLELQGYLGVAPENRVILPKNAVQDLAVNINTRFNSGENIAGLIQQQADYWGEKYWPAVERQLLGENFPKEVAVIANMLSFGQRNGAFLLAEGMNPERRKFVNEQVSRIPNADKDIKESIGSVMGSFSKSLMMQLNGPEVISAYASSIDTLAKGYVIQGSTPQEAVTKAYNQIIVGSYDFATTTRDTIRIPRFLEKKPTNVATSEVTLGTNFARFNIEQYPLVVRSISGISPEEAKRQYISSLKSFGYFSTKPDERGVIMVDPDGYMVKVREPDTGVERPFTLTWDELKTLSKEEAIRLQEQMTRGFISPEFRNPPRGK